MTKPNVFIRGIYASALTKLFLDAGYPIIFPSKKVQARFNIPFRQPHSYSKDITIQDRHDRQGVSIMFKKAVWDVLEQSNFKDFPLWQTQNPNLIIFKARFHKNAIYRGLIVDSNKQANYSNIRLMPEAISQGGQEAESDFITNVGRYSRFIPDAKEGVFQVTHEDNGKNGATLGSFYTIPGDLVVIVPYNNKVIISKEISSGRQKKRLFDLGKDFQQSKKYGFIFRTAAELATDAEIGEEVERLEQDLIQTQTTITQFPDRIGEIYSHYRSINVIFPEQVKRQFDDIRRRVCPTIECHHLLKSIPEARYTYTDEKPEEEIEDPGIFNIFKKISVEELMDYTEDLMADTDSAIQAKIGRNFLQIYFNNFVQLRKRYEIVHQKLDGKTMYLSSGFIKSINKAGNLPEIIVLKRRMKDGGIYDGLKTPIERGDYAISEYRSGNWYYVTAYYSYNHELKGRYYNINTPIEFTDMGIHYIDLEIDIVENMVGDKTIIDRDRLDQALKLNIISEELHGKALGIADNIIEERF